MKFVPVQIAIEPDVLDIYQKIAEIQKNSAIAGGYLSDRFMGTSYKDVDIFIRTHEEKDERIDVCMRHNGYETVDEQKTEDDYGFSFRTKTYFKNSKKIHLVFTNKGIRHLKFFDLRMREFIYFRGQSYASIEALSDIEQKIIVIGPTIDPLSAIYRAYTFAHRYGFKIQQERFDFTCGVFNVKSYSVDDISQKGDPSFTSFMVKMMDPQTLKLPSTYNQDGYYYNTPCEILSDEMYERDVHEAFQQKLLENMPDERLQISIDDSFVQRYKAQQIDHLRAVLRKDRLTLITGKSELYFEIEALIERDTPIDPETLDELYWDTDLEHLFGVVDNYSRTIAYLQAQSSIEVFIVRTPKYLKNHYVKPYARNKIAIVKLEGLASFWYNKGTKKIIDPEASRFPATLVEMLLHETKELQPI